jgi:hypothetical protein
MVADIQTQLFVLQSYLMMMVTMKMAMQVKLLVTVLPLLAS